MDDNILLADIKFIHPNHTEDAQNARRMENI
jgi:hypothetical protein